MEAADFIYCKPEIAFKSFNLFLFLMKEPCNFSIIRKGFFKVKINSVIQAFTDKLFFDLFILYDINTK